MREKPRDWTDVERIAGVRRTTNAVPTQNDVQRMTAKVLRRWPAWRRKLR